MKDFLLYTGARFGVFVVTYAVIFGVYVAVAGTPVPVLGPLLLAAVISMAISVYLLRGLRERAAAGVQGRAQRITHRYEQMKAKEDVD